MPNTIHIYSGITSGRVLNGELLYTKILDVNLFAFAYRLLHEDFSSTDGTCFFMPRYNYNTATSACNTSCFLFK